MKKFLFGSIVLFSLFGSMIALIILTANKEDQFNQPKQNNTPQTTNESLKITITIKQT